MKIGVISDTHIPERAKCLPRQLLEAFHGVDMIIHAGDLADLKVLDELKEICPNVKAVWGNMDPQEVRDKLPERELIKIGKHTIGLMHGYGAPNNLLECLKSSFKEDKVGLIIFGHSHRAMNELINGIIFFNPGSPVDKIFSDYTSYGIIEINDKIKAKIIRI
ncbi:MAG: metallophosphoesterase [Candidatus Omnitrophota bacterium]